MRKYTLLSFVALLTNLGSFAATDITTSAVSGHWTMSGSPYNIHNSIYVPSGATLIIDSGVEVVFTGAYSLTVSGLLKAQGTSTAPILFHAQDTTGWSDLSLGTGGWAGISVPYLAVGDSTKFNYCKIYDIKNGVVSIGRPITVANTEIFHCTSGGNLIYLDNYYGNTLFTGCNIHNNIVTVHSGGEEANIIFASNISGWGSVMPGMMEFDNTQVHDNSSTATIYVRFGTMIIKNSSWRYNQTDDEGVIELACSDSVYLDNNLIDHNTSNGMAAVHCLSSFVEITNNHICNNADLLPGCTATQGGGGLHLSNNCRGLPVTYTVRNNVIANNSCIQTGGGIYIFHAGAIITNNVFVNNTSTTEGSALGVDDTWNTLIIKNNIFHHNRSFPDTTLAFLSSFEGGNYIIDNNILDYEIHQCMNSAVPLTLVGDTTDNFIGVDPMFIQPTTALGNAADADTANFNVSTLSICVNRGDSVNAQSYPTDYVGGMRVVARIDIGAYECQTCENMPESVQSFAPSSFLLYPNPTSGMVTIDLPVAAGTITVTDITGREMLTMHPATKQLQIDLSSLASGVYVANWQVDGHAAVCKKLVIQ